MVSVCYSIMPLDVRWRRLMNCFTYSFFDMNSSLLTETQRSSWTPTKITVAVLEWHTSLIFGDWICNVIIKTTMEPGPWTLIIYSAYVLITWTHAMWHSFYGMWCNSKPLSMICLVFTQASSVLTSVLVLWANVIAGFSICSESTCLHIASANSPLAPLDWKSLWSKRAGGY